MKRNRRSMLTLRTAIFSLAILISVFSASCNYQKADGIPAATEKTPQETAVMSTNAGPSSSGEILKFKSIVTVEVYRPVGGNMVKIYEHESSNVITNIGLHVIARQITGQAATYQWTAALGGNDLWYTNAAVTRIGLSTDNGPALNATHSSWQTVDSSYPSNIEIITGGLPRAVGTYTQSFAYTAGSGTTKGSLTYTVAATFTATSAFTGVQKAGLFNGVYNTNNGAATGTPISALVAENTFTAVDLDIGDQIAVTWRITL